MWGTPQKKRAAARISGGWFASGTVMSTPKYRLIPNRVLSPVSGPNPGKNNGIKWRRGRDSNPRYLFK